MMRKMMILTLAVLGMVLGSFAVVQPVKASSFDCDVFEDPYNCFVTVCTSCIFWDCPDEDPGLVNSACIN